MIYCKDCQHLRLEYYTDICIPCYSSSWLTPAAEKKEKPSKLNANNNCKYFLPAAKLKKIVDKMLY